MADKNMTRSQALAIAIESVDDALALEVLTRMKEQIDKPKAKTSTKSKTRLENEATARHIYEVAGTEPFDGKWVMAHSTALTPQKVVGIMKVAVEMGLFTRTQDGKKVLYCKQ